MSDKDYLEDVLEQRERYQTTITVRDFKEILNKYDNDTFVFITWESTVNCVSKRNFYISKTNSLYIDSYCNIYKEKFAKDKNENED